MAQIIKTNQDQERTTIKIEEGEHVYIQTPFGLIKLFMNEHYRTITTWVKDTEINAFYSPDKKIVKKTHKTQESSDYRVVTIKGIEE